MTTCKLKARRMKKQPGCEPKCSCKATGREGLTIDAMEAACDACRETGPTSSCDLCEMAQIHEAVNGRR